MVDNSGVNNLSGIRITTDLERHSTVLRTESTNIPKTQNSKRIRAHLAFCVFGLCVFCAKHSSTALHSGKDLAVSPLWLPRKLILICMRMPYFFRNLASLLAPL